MSGNNEQGSWRWLGQGLAFVTVAFSVPAFLHQGLAKEWISEIPFWGVLALAAWGGFCGSFASDSLDNEGKKFFEVLRRSTAPWLSARLFSALLFVSLVVLGFEQVNDQDVWIVFGIAAIAAIFPTEVLKLLKGAASKFASGK